MGNAAGRGGVAYGQAISLELGIKMENAALAMLNCAKKMMIYKEHIYMPRIE